MPSPTTERSSLLPPRHASSASRTSARSISSNTYHRPSCRSYLSSSPCEHGTHSPHASRPTSQDSYDRGHGYTDERNTATNTPRASDRVKAALDGRVGDAAGSADSDSGDAHELHTTVADEGGKHGGTFKGTPDLSHRLLGDMIADGVLGTGDGGEIPLPRRRHTGSGKDGDEEGEDEEGGEYREDDDDDPPLAPNGNGKGPPPSAAALSTTQYLARRHNLPGRRKMYLFYYLPFLNWMAQYRWSYLQGDLVAALTMASFYIPMSLSYAENLGHVPPINGLYSFVFNPFVYALLGSCPQMVVGPEAAGSLLVGSVVKSSVDKEGQEDDNNTARIAGVVTGMAGAVILVAGLTRLGFLDSVLSRPFLRGFISAIGFVIFVDSLIPETGLSGRAKHVGGVSHGSSWGKLEFLASNLGRMHGMTCGIAFGSFAIIMICRQLKKYLQPRYPKIAYIPDRFLVVVLSAVFAWKFDWAGKGVDILGDVQSSTGAPFPFRFPIIPSSMKHVREAMSTSFLIALLGFFESSVAAKSLGGGGGGAKGEGLQGIPFSANRELVALGVANIVGGCFMALPAFGGYGRSKVNASTGGTTPMSSILLSIITVICVLFLLPYFFFIPKAVLSAMISVVAYSLIEEAPHDIMFFIRIRGWSELAMMALIFFATFFYSLPLGIALGVGLSLLQVIRHSTKPRIQILGKVPGTLDAYENAEDNPQSVEFIEGCLIVKIPEPLTFANTGDLKNRLRRLELYGTTAAHPALPRVRNPEHNKNIIFDVHGVTSIDGSGAQVLAEIVDAYVGRKERVFFCRVPNMSSPVYKMFEKSGIVERTGGHGHFVKSVDEALRMAELQSMSDLYRDESEQVGG